MPKEKEFESAKSTTIEEDLQELEQLKQEINNPYPQNDQEVGFSQKLLSELSYPLSKDDDFYDEINRGVVFLLKGKVVVSNAVNDNYSVKVETYPIIKGVQEKRTHWLFSDLPLIEGQYYSMLGIFFFSKRNGAKFSPTFRVKKAERVES